MESSVKMSVSVLGLGYIGLPTALLLAEGGASVYGYDTSKKRREMLEKGDLPFKENGLGELFERVKKKHEFHVTGGIQSCDFYIVSVPTPQIDGKTDLQYVKAAVQSIRDVFQDGQTIVIESTIGPRDCVDTLIPLVESWGKKFHFVHCPERAIPGNTLHEMVQNDRIIGGDTKESAQKAQKLYVTFVRGSIYCTDTIVAASCKVMENTYRAVNIALANEFAQLAEELGFNVWEAIELANKHPRVHIHQPGPGVGGHCIPIDPWFFVGESSHATLIKHALLKNENMAEYIAEKLKIAIQSAGVKKPSIAILGYAYKKNVDDFRETPAEQLRTILAKHYPVLVTDRFVKNPFIVDEEKVLSTTNVWIVATDHTYIQTIDLGKYPNLKCIYDTRNCLTSRQIGKFTGKFILFGKE